MTATPAPGHFAHLIDEGIANSVRARKHLNAMDPARRAQLEREWLAAEAVNDPKLIAAERQAIVARAEKWGGL